MANVAILVLSHVEELAEGAAHLFRQASKDVDVYASGGLGAGEIGTSVDRIHAVLEQIPEEQEILVFYDIGSAKMNAEMIVEMFPNYKISISDAPLIEAGYVATISAGLGLSIDEVKEKAETGYKKDR